MFNDFLSRETKKHQNAIYIEPGHSLQTVLELIIHIKNMKLDEPHTLS